MRHSPSRLLITCLLFMALGVLLLSMPTVEAQVFPDDFIKDDEGRLFVYVSLGGKAIPDANESHPILIDMENPMPLYMQVNNTSTDDLMMMGRILFFYQGFQIFNVTVIDPNTGLQWVSLPANVMVPPVSVPLNISDWLEFYGFQLVTGIWEVKVEFAYYIQGIPGTIYTLGQIFYVKFPVAPDTVFTSVAGISAGLGTIGAVSGTAMGLKNLLDAIKTAVKIKGIRSKAAEIRSLPNLAVLGALPLLFSILAGMAKIRKKKKKKKEEEEAPTDTGVSEYIIRQRLREVAPDAWPREKCPQCRRKWNKKTNFCKKCKFDEEDAARYYANYLAGKVPRALRVMGKRKKASVNTLAKKTKMNQYNAGVVAASFVDTEVGEITKVATPFKSFVLNVAGLAFMVLTWDQLLGDRASSFQSTLTYVGAALSLAVLIALYVSRKSQIKKIRAAAAEDAPVMPTEAEAEAEVEEAEEAADEAEEPFEEIEEAEEEVKEEVEQTSEEIDEAFEDME